MNKLFLIDGHSLIFRMYYAFLKRPMINSRGVDTSILYGFTKYLLELVRKQSPSHLAVAFDPPGGTFRHKLYSQYKANRVDTPQLVIDALEPLKDICKSLNIPILMVPGYEADDVISTVALKCARPTIEVYMLTPDKDYGQVLRRGVYQYKPGKFGGEDEILSEEDICLKYGIQSSLQVIDLLTICGDSSDNIPGVPGVGEVTASKLLSKYGSLENIYANLDQLTLKQKESFEKAKEYIDLSRELVTIKQDVPIDFSMEECILDIQCNDLLVSLFDFYEFSSLRKYIPNFQGDNTLYRKNALNKGKKHNIINCQMLPPEDLCKMAEKEKECSILFEIDKGEQDDTLSEQSNSNAGGIFSKIKRMLLAVTSSDGKYYSSESDDVEDFKLVIENPQISKYSFDIKLLSGILFNQKIYLRGRLMDIEILHYLVNPEANHDIDTLAYSYLNVFFSTNSKNEEKHPREISLFDDYFSSSSNSDENDRQQKETELADSGVSEVSTCTIGENNEEDPNIILAQKAIATILLGKAIYKELEEKRMANLYDSLEGPLIVVLSKMEQVGVSIDRGCLKQLTEQLRSQLSQLESLIRSMADDYTFNIHSPKQLGIVLFEKLGLDSRVKANRRGSYPTDEATLQKLYFKHPIIEQILEFRETKKILSTYLEPFENYISSKDSKVHTTFNQALTSTGRLSSSNPNLQNLPIRTERGRHIRKAFISEREDGLIMSADYSQIELRIMAHLSQDEHLIKAFEQGMDIHTATAAKIFSIRDLEQVSDKQRRIAKTANFGIMYGISPFGLSQRLNISRTEAKQIIDDYFKLFPAIRNYINFYIDFAREHNYVETLFGRRRYIQDINSPNANIRALAERSAINAPIQGSSADIIKMAMLRVDEAISKKGLKSRMIIQIHDELVFDAYPEELEQLKAIVVNEMESVTRLSVPLLVECNHGKNYLEAH